MHMQFVAQHGLFVAWENIDPPMVGRGTTRSTRFFHRWEAFKKSFPTIYGLPMFVQWNVSQISNAI